MNALAIESGELCSVHRQLGRIHIGPAAQVEDGLYLSPGWLDVQVNGFAGHDVNGGDLDVEGFELMTHALHAQGVARYLPTVITASPAHLTRCLMRIVEASDTSNVVGRAVAGIHLEGPFISPEDGARGAHPIEQVRAPDPVLFDELQHAADGRIRVVTLAPEGAGAADFIAQLVDRGIIVALGHTVADAHAIRAAVDAGASLATHLGNGAPARLPRHPNMIWEQLAEDRLYASAIFDGHHLPKSVMKVFARVKGSERLLLTSDAVALAGQPPGVYDGQVGGKVELHPSGRLTVFASEYLAGSASSLSDAVRTAVTQVGLSPEQALTMVGRTPRQLLKRDDPDDWTLARISNGDVEVLAVAVDGELVVDRLDG